jgi:glycine/D-amino acid oxidase-like deaminating enzyme
MNTPPRPDVLIVGAGIVGAACAYELSRAGLRVEVLEAGFVGGGTTAAGMGHVVVMDDSEAQFALTGYSLRLWEELAAHLPASAEAERCGTLWVAEDEAQMEAVHAKHAFYAARGVTTEILDSGDVAKLEPNLRAPLAGALRVPGDMVVYPPAVARWLLDRALEHGAVLREGCLVERVTEGGVVIGRGGSPGGQRVAAGLMAAEGGSGEMAPEWRSGAVCAAPLPGSRLEGGVVINAAGAAAARLTPGLPIVPRKGHLVITDRYPGFCRHQLVELGYLTSAHTMNAASVAFNIQPRRTGQLLIGSSRELVGWDATTNRRVLRQMLARAAHFMPALANLSAIRSWTGFRPATPDKLPLIGRWGEGERLWIAAGHEGLGITTALGTARLLADQLLGRVPEIDTAPFAPGRVVEHAEG